MLTLTPRLKAAAGYCQNARPAWNGGEQTPSLFMSKAMRYLQLSEHYQIFPVDRNNVAIRFGQVLPLRSCDPSCLSIVGKPVDKNFYRPVGSEVRIPKSGANFRKGDDVRVLRFIVPSGP